MTENAQDPKDEFDPELYEVDEEYEPDPKPIPQFLVGLEQYEAVLNEGAAKIANRYRVPDGKWRIHLVENTKGAPILRIKGGAIAQIIITWPAAQKEIKRVVEDAFRFIAKNNVIDSFAIQNVLYAKKIQNDVRKWIKEECGEENEILLDLVPKYRLIETVTTTYKLEDTKTGKSIEVTTTSKDHFNRRDMTNWIALSRLVREVENVAETNSDSDTPELNNALGEENA